MKQFDISEKVLHKIVSESIKKVLSESLEEPDPSYTHFLVRKTDNKIIDGWDYTGYDIADIKYYIKLDIEDMDIDPREVKVLTRRFLERSGINPQDWKNWTN